MKTQHTRTYKGFTLVELLVSMMITLMIITALITATKMATEALGEARKKTRAANLAEEPIKQLTQDLESMIIQPSKKKEWLLIEKNAELSADDIGPDSGGTRSLPNPVYLSFFTSSTDRYNGDFDKTPGGDISLVRYTLQYQDVADAEGDFKIFSLYRERINPDETFGDPQSSSPTGYLVTDDSSTENTNEGLFESQPAGWDPSTITEDKNFIAENVYEMTLTFNFQVVEGDPSNNSTLMKAVSVIVNPNEETGEKSVKSLSIRDTNVKINGDEDLLKKNESGLTLKSIDFSVTILSDEGMNRIRKITSLNDTTKLNQFLLENSQSYSKSVLVPVF